MKIIAVITILLTLQGCAAAVGALAGGAAAGVGSMIGNEAAKPDKK